MSDILDIAINNVQNSKSAFCRFITVNDTGKNGSHQSGFYIPKCASSLLFEQPGVKGEIKSREVEIKWQDDFYTNSRLIYYGQKSRNEYRITRFGGKSFPFFEEDNVGDLLIITRYGDDEYYGFVLKNDNDIEEFFAVFNLSSNKTNQLINISKETQFNSIYKSMINTILDKYNNFPSTNEMANHAREIYNSSFKIKSNQILSSPDRILLNWINTEYDLFKSFEEKVYSNQYKQSFNSCQELIDFSNTILNRRKSRAGKSLENHLSSIFTIADLQFEEQAVTEDNKKPDFLFPSSEAYHNILFPTDQLIFLGAKTTCKDRWRQVLNEADRIKTKYLFTLQQGISKNQLAEMKHENLKLVVPAQYKNAFDSEYHSEIKTLSEFINMVDAIQHPQVLK